MTGSRHRLRLPVLRPNSSASLLVRPLRLHDEHEIGYWLRLAHLNGLRDPCWMLNPGTNRGGTTLRICPLCLRQADVYWRAAWLEIDRPWCAIHHVWLIDRCPSCGRTLRWGQARLVNCRCGHDLREIDASAVGPEVADALGLVPVSVLLWLGGVARFGLLGKPLKGASTHVVAEMASLIELGAAQTIDWPSAFFLMLDRNRVSAAASASIQLELLASALPGLTRRLSKIRDKGWRTKLTDAVGAYVSSRRPGLAPLVWKNTPGSRPPTVAKVARHLGVRAARFAGALDDLGHMGVASRQTAGGRVRRLVSNEAVSAAKQLLDARMSAKPVARQLGLSVARVKQLISEGVFEVSGGKLNRNAVDGLRANLLACAETKQLPRDGVPLTHVLRFHVPVCRTGLFLRALLGKELACYMSQTAEPQVGLVLSQSSVRAWLAEASAVPRPGLTLPEVASVLGLKQQVVYHLVQKGLIHAAVQQVGKRKAKVVTHQALLDFKNSFMPLAWVAAYAGVDHRHGLRWAHAESLEVVSGPTVDGGRQYFVRLTDGSRSDPMDGLWTSATRDAEQRQRSVGLGCENNASPCLTAD